MEAKRTTQQVIDWLKAAEKRQQNWQQEVKKRWAVGRGTLTSRVWRCNPVISKVEILGYGVMVTLQILVLPFLVRVRVPQQKNDR